MADRAKSASVVRLAVAAFGSWGELRNAVQAYVADHPFKTINCLALRDVLANQVAGFLPANQAVRNLSFTASPSPVGCTDGIVAEGLAKRVKEGDPNTRWRAWNLADRTPRHASGARRR